MIRQHKQGFTLIETVIAMGLLTVLSMLMFTAVQASIDSSHIASAESRVQSNIRETVPEMVRETELAAKATTAAGVNGLTGITVFRDGAAMDLGVEGDMVVFQVPLDNTGATWSTPIQYRFINEDTNGNGFLDAGEDTVNANSPSHDGNGNGMLTRCIVREQDLDGNGNFDGTGERRIMGAANELQTVRFAMNLTGDVLTVTVRSRQVMENSGQMVSVEGVQGQQLEARALSAEATTQVYIFN